MNQVEHKKQGKYKEVNQDISKDLPEDNIGNMQQFTGPSHKYGDTLDSRPED